MKKMATGVLLFTMLNGSVFLVGHAALAKDQAGAGGKISPAYYFENVLANDLQINRVAQPPEVNHAPLQSSTALALLGLSFAALAGLVAGVALPRQHKINSIVVLPAGLNLRRAIPSSESVRNASNSTSSGTRLDFPAGQSERNSPPVRKCRARFNFHLPSVERASQLQLRNPCPPSQHHLFQ